MALWSRAAVDGAPASLGRPVGLIAAAAGVGAMVLFFAVYSPYEPAGADWSPAWPRGVDDPAVRRWIGFGQPGVAFVSDGASGTWVRLTASPGVRPGVSWTTTDLPAHRTVEVRTRWRGENVVPGEYRYQTARLTLCVTDPDGHWRFDVPHVAANLYGTKGWHEAGRRLVLPEWVTTARLAVAHGGVSGVVEVVECTAVPQRRRADAPWVIALWWFAWLVGATVAALRLDLFRRPQGRAVFAAAGLILVAVTMPESWFQPIELLIGGRPAIGQSAPSVPGSPKTGETTRPTAPPPRPVPPPPPVRPSRWRSAIANADLHGIAHVVLFAVLAVVTARCFKMRLIAPATDRGELLRPLAGLLIYGVAAEVIQCLTVTRGPGAHGAMMNWMGIGLGLMLHEVAVVLKAARTG